MKLEEEYSQLIADVEHILHLIDTVQIDEVWYKAIQRQVGGSIWNSGGGCMIVSVPLRDNLCMHITDECLTIYAHDNLDELDLDEDPLYIKWMV